MNGRPVTVFGGTGFLGRHIVRRLVADGHQVRVAARRPGGKAPGDRVTFVPTDVRRSADVSRALEGAGSAINTVSLYVESRADSFRDIHEHAARRIGAAARESGVERLVHVSGLGVDEASGSRYVRARASGERRVREVFPDATILRPSVIFGPGDAFLTALRRVTAAPLIPIFGEGRTRLQPVHVDDVASAAAAVLRRPQSAGTIYELGGADVLEYRAIIRLLLAATGRRRPPVPVPFAAWRVLAGIASVLPGSPLTRDQVLLMQQDNVVAQGTAGFAELGLEPLGLSRYLESGLAG